MAADFDQGEGETVQFYEGESVKPGVLPGVLVGEKTVWRNGKPTVTDIGGVFPSGFLEHLDSHGSFSTAPSLSTLCAAGLNSLTMLGVGLVAKAVLCLFNTSCVSGREQLLAALERPPGTPLLTLCNHHSCFDDPGVWGALLSASTLASSRAMRWSVSASEVIFLNRPLAAFFNLGKVIPIVRGWGTEQPAMRFLEARLSAGGWVNLFPEGKVTPGGPPYAGRRYRWGVGSLLASCRPSPPLVLPICHVGMDRLLPNPAVAGEQQCMLPRPGNFVTINIGKPWLMDVRPREGEDRAQLKSRLTSEVQIAMETLDRETRALHVLNVSKWLKRWFDQTDPVPSIFT